MDLSAALVGITIFGPLMVGIYLARKMEGASRVIFSQTRVGKGGKTFKFHKFSSMITTTDEEEREFFIQLEKDDPRRIAEYKKNNFKFKEGEDPRITSVGRFTRKYSIDELPQFFNVLKGEMSLVGPRAYKPDELEYKMREYPQTKKDVAALLQVKPGITGVWQVGGRSDIPFPKRVKMDADYARRISLREDLLIILKTPGAMLGGKGAY